MKMLSLGYMIIVFILGLAGGFALGAALHPFGKSRRMVFGASDTEAASKRRIRDAHGRALDALGAGIVIAGERGATANARARLLLGLAGEGTVKESSLDYRLLSSLRAKPELAPLLVSGEGGTELSVGEGKARRTIDVRAFCLDPATARGDTVLVFTDVTETAQLLEELSNLASQDPLTGVNNRRRFGELGERDLELARRSLSSLGLLMLDVDYFKRVNDGHGHAVGDKMLKGICHACCEVLRSTDILCRYGGEEFAALLPGSGPEESLLVAERLRERIDSLKIASEGGSVSVTVSLGVYSGVPGKDDDLSLYLRRADEALYRSKALGRDRVTYWEPIDHKAMRS